MSERQLMIDVSRQFYLQDRSKMEIASSLGISRFKVARLLDQARDSGVVTISIMDNLTHDAGLEGRLISHLALADAVVTRGSADEAENRNALARAAAAYIRDHIHPGDTFGFSWGRTLAAIGNYIDVLPESTLVALTGGVGTNFQQSPVEVLRRVSSKSQVRTMSIFAPLLVESAGTARALRRDPGIASVLNTYNQLDLAVLSVGSWKPPITQLLDYLSPRDVADLEREDARAEMAGIFLRGDGTLANTQLPSRRISITPEQLVATPRVVAVAGGDEKLPAIKAVLRSRLVNVLITDDATARQLLNAAPVPPGPRVPQRETRN